MGFFDGNIKICLVISSFVLGGLIPVMEYHSKQEWFPDQKSAFVSTKKVILAKYKGFRESCEREFQCEFWKM